MKISKIFQKYLRKYTIEQDFSIIALPEYAMRTYKFDKPHIVISIKTPGANKADIKPNFACLDKLFLEFQDIDLAKCDKYIDCPELHPFNKKQAVEIIEFINFHLENIEGLIVNCEAGVSRSPAIAAAIALLLGQDNQIYFKKYLPNMYVYRTLIDTFFEEYGYIEPEG